MKQNREYACGQYQSRMTLYPTYTLHSPFKLPVISRLAETHFPGQMLTYAFPGHVNLREEARVGSINAPLHLKAARS